MVGFSVVVISGVVDVETSESVVVSATVAGSGLPVLTGCCESGGASAGCVLDDSAPGRSKVLTVAAASLS